MAARPQPTREVDQAAARDLVRMSGQMGVPVTLIGNRPVVGFNQSEIDRLLGLNSK